MMVKTRLAAPPKAVRSLLVGALLLATQVGYAQNSFNRWEATPVTTPTPRAKVRKAAQPEPNAKAPDQALALAGRQKTQDSLQIAQGKSVTLRRGLGQRLRQSKYSKPDAGYYDFVWQHLRYPPTALRAGLTGQVMVRLNVSPDGEVLNSVVTGDDIRQKQPTEKGASVAAGRQDMRQSAQELLRSLHFESAPAATQEEVPVLYVAQ